MDLFEGMLQKDKDEFKNVCARLLSRCFIVKRNEQTKSDYYFIERHRDVFEKYLGILGFVPEINTQLGVVQLTSRDGSNHLRLKMADSIILLILRILYDERKRELSLTDALVTVGDIQEKYLALKVRDKQIDKTTMNNALRLFKRFNLIEILDKDVTQEDARLIIYDSIVMALRGADIRTASELLDKYRKGEESDEDAFEAAADQLAPLP
ncbi:MAG: DUF4194 domain-containing protein [Lachnospiraceae bacterium]|nr:DUF4194 domain-containing protein [Candidatus Hippenecus merdae]